MSAPSPLVRRAQAEDATEAVRVLRASISESCVLDHRNDPQILERWLRNKTPELFANWLTDKDSYYWVALLDERICGVAGTHRSGDIRLCYVEPAMARNGVGRALLATWEAELGAAGTTQLRLRSSATARAFYERHGYQACAAPEPVFLEMLAYPYAKSL